VEVKIYISALIKGRGKEGGEKREKVNKEGAGKKDHVQFLLVNFWRKKNRFSRSLDNWRGKKKLSKGGSGRKGLNAPQDPRRKS